MSLVGIDVGSSAVKVAAYRDTGELLAVMQQELTPLHPQPGWWEQDPEEVWDAVSQCMRGLMQVEEVQRDPPKVMAISASGRENFPADAQGNPLGPAIMGADIRGAEFEVPPEGSPIPEPWTLSCGHLRERMDPIFRLSWWRKYRPEIMAKAKYFLGWHDFLTFRISGRICTDRSSASRYLVYDLQTHKWSPERVAEYRLEPDLLPEVLPWGSVIGTVRREVAEEWGISPHTLLALGGHDVTCAAVGAGVIGLRDACLISGSYENMIIVTSDPPTAKMLLSGLSVMPHPGEPGLVVLAVCPTGNAVLNWARDLLRVSIGEMETELHKGDLKPSPIIAVPYLSGSMVYWEGGRKAKGALIGLTLATSRADIVQAFMESIAYDHVNTLSLLSSEGVRVTRVRATGGGSRSSWWTQLKADMMGIPIEVAGQPEPGTFGAVLLAAMAIGLVKDLQEASLALAGTSRVHEPDPARASLHKEQFERYRKAVATLLSTLF